MSNRLWLSTLVCISLSGCFLNPGAIKTTKGSPSPQKSTTLAKAKPSGVGNAAAKQVGPKLPQTAPKTVTTVQPITNANLPTTDAKVAIQIKGTVSVVNTVMAQMRSMLNKPAVGGAAHAASLTAAAPYRILDVGTTAGATDSAASATADVCPNTSYDSLVWYYQTTASSSVISDDGTVETDSETDTTEGRIPYSTGEVAAERYVTTESWTYAIDATDSIAPGAYLYDKAENVQLSQYRNLGRYETKGTWTQNADGHSNVSATQAFVSADGSKKNSTTLDQQNVGPVTTSHLKGDVDGGGSIDMTFTTTDDTTTATDGSNQVNGTYVLQQNGTLVNAAGLSFNINSTQRYTYAAGVATEKSAMTVGSQGIFVQIQYTNDPSAGQSGSGILLANDAAQTQLGTIAIDWDSMIGTITFGDSSTDQIDIAPFFDALNAANNVSI